MKLLSIENLSEILNLTKQLNEGLPLSELKNRQVQMFEFENYRCFGLFKDDQLIGVSSG